MIPAWPGQMTQHVHAVRRPRSAHPQQTGLDTQPDLHPIRPGYGKPLPCHDPMAVCSSAGLSLDPQALVSAWMAKSGLERRFSWHGKDPAAECFKADAQRWQRKASSSTQLSPDHSPPSSQAAPQPCQTSHSSRPTERYRNNPVLRFTNQRFNLIPTRACDSRSTHAALPLAG